MEQANIADSCMLDFLLQNLLVASSNCANLKLAEAFVMAKALVGCTEE